MFIVHTRALVLGHCKPRRPGDFFNSIWLSQCRKIFGRGRVGLKDWPHGTRLDVHMQRRLLSQSKASGGLESLISSNCRTFDHRPSYAARNAGQHRRRR